jgi:predicted transport protein
MVPFYRNHVFAEVKPFASRLDLGLALGDPTTVQDPQGLLKDTGGFAKKDRITHKLELRVQADLQAALPWLKRAYERDGA